MEPFDMMDASVPKKSFLTPDEVSQLSGIAVQTLASRRCNMQPSDFVRVGGTRVRYPRAVIVQWLADEYVTTSKPTSTKPRR